MPSRSRRSSPRSPRQTRTRRQSRPRWWSRRSSRRPSHDEASSPGCGVVVGPLNPSPEPVAIEPEPEPEPEPVAEIPEAIEVVEAPEIAEPELDGEITASAAAATAAFDPEQVEAVLVGVLDDLGSAHHRPFSRG